jgi:tetratricopeptide (TPR) repeat protein
MSRAAVIAGCLLSVALLSGQTQPAPSLMTVQSLIDQGKLKEAEALVRQHLESNLESADAHYLLGYILFREGRPQPSLAEYRQAARYRKPGALDLQVMGSDYFLLEDYAAADKWLTSSVEANPADPLAQYYLGRTKYNQKHFEEAVRAFTACLKLDAGNVKTATYLGLAYEALGKTEDALAAYRAAISLSGAGKVVDSAPYFNLGHLLADTGRPADAVPYLLRAVQIAPSDAQSHRELGKAYLELNQIEQAQTELEKAADLTPESAPVHFLLAQAYKRRGMAEKARAETEHYTALTGAHSAPDSPLAEARSLLETGKVSDAEHIARRYLEAHQSSADAHYLLAYILFKKQDAVASLAEYTAAARYRTPQSADLEAVAADYVLLKDYPDADKWFTKAVEWNPGDPLGWYYLGRTKYNENRFDEAIAAFQQCLKLDPRNVKAEDNLGLSYEGLAQTDQAMAAYRTAISWQTDSLAKDSGPLLNLGSLLADNDRTEEALPYLLDAAAISLRDYRVHRQLGKAYTHMSQLEKARTELEKAVELAPEDAPVHYMLGQVYQKLGLAEKARQEHERYSLLRGSKPARNN